MDYIVLVKQVPDIKNIPAEAWDLEKGTLKRGLLDNVCNELDRQALAFALKMRETTGGRVFSLTMGPPFAAEVLRYALSIGADTGILLTDRKLGGADTAATAYPLGQAIRKIERDFLGGRRDYVVVSGMQSVDGDTAQVPPQVAEELGMPHIAYATGFDFTGDTLQVKRITRQGAEVNRPVAYPLMITVAQWTEPPFASFGRTRWAGSQALTEWSAADIGADDSRIGLAGSRTAVYRVFSPKEVSKRNCVLAPDAKHLAALIKEAYARRAGSAAAEEDKPAYRLPEGKSPSHSGGVWVYAEHEAGALHPATLELLGKATELARPLGAKVGAVLAGHDVKGLSARLIAGGADLVYVAEDRRLESFLPAAYARAVAAMIEKYQPQIMLFGATPLGRELGPRVAYRTGSGLTADCTGLDIIDYQRGKQELTAILQQTRPALGGNIMAAIITQNAAVQMSTARPGVMRALEPDEKRAGEVIEETPVLEPADFGVEIVSAERSELESAITDAGAIACGGAGCRTRDNYERYVVPLAESLGEFLGEKAAAGASRAAVEMGFAERSQQVGQTGQTVKPRVYIAIGVSGAVQHLTGMQNADIIVAINKDPKAPIFKAADFGMVASLEEVVPGLIEAFREEETAR